MAWFKKAACEVDNKLDAAVLLELMLPLV